MTIKEIIEELQDSITPQDLRKLPLKDRLSFLNVLEEYENPKMQRSSYNVNPELPDTIKIEVVKNADS